MCESAFIVSDVTAQISELREASGWNELTQFGFQGWRCYDKNDDGAFLHSSEINPTRCNNCVYSSQWLYATCFG
jgi:hypothetical protein